MTALPSRFLEQNPQSHSPPSPTPHSPHLRRNDGTPLRSPIPPQRRELPANSGQYLTFPPVPAPTPRRGTVDSKPPPQTLGVVTHEQEEKNAILRPWLAAARQRVVARIPAAPCGVNMAGQQAAALTDAGVIGPTGPSTSASGSFASAGVVVFLAVSPPWHVRGRRLSPLRYLNNCKIILFVWNDVQVLEHHAAVLLLFCVQDLVELSRKLSSSTCAARELSSGSPF